MSPTDVNVAQVILDYARFQGWMFVPLLAFSAASRQRRWLVPAGLACGVASWWILVGLWLHSLGGLTDAWPGWFDRPLQRGTSILIVEHTFAVALFWIVTVIARGVLYVVGRARGISSARARQVSIAALVLYTVVATWVAHGVTMGDTVVAPGFTRGGWDRVVLGMSHTDVLRVVGVPLPEADQPWFAGDQGGQCWLSNHSTGYFACIWFHDHTVTRKAVWYAE